MLNNGVYVIAFSYPVVAKGMARIRTQMSASFSKEDLDSALHSFALAKDKIL
jgi:glycine C-acetyltransferase